MLPLGSSEFSVSLWIQKTDGEEQNASRLHGSIVN